MTAGNAGSEQAPFPPLLPRGTGSRRVLSLGHVGLLCSLMCVVACADAASQGPADITQGVWVGDGGADQFLFDLQGSGPDLGGVVHILSGGKKISEMVITRARYDAPDLEMFVARSDATYRGRVDLDRGRIRGVLSFGGRPGPEMELEWAEPDHHPGFAALAGGERFTYRPPPDLGDGLTVAAAEDVGLDPVALAAVVDAVANGEAGLIHSLLVMREGKLVLDEYFHGFSADDYHRTASVTKSVAALLVGAALDRGMIPSLDVPLLDFFPYAEEGVSPGWEDETLHHLLSMSMGVDWTAQEMEGVHGTGPDFFRTVLARSISSPPGSKWDYASANVNLLAGVIHRATGRHADAFAAEVLFEPLGIEALDWEYGKVDGYNLMDGSLQLRPRDLAKIGVMVAAGGRWNGEQVIGEQWVREFTSPHHATGQPLGGYGDLWWLGELPGRDGPEPLIVANGWGSQFIVIFPRLDMVVVTTGGNEDNGRHLDLADVLTQYLTRGA